MKKLVLATALWFAAAGVVTAADKAMEKMEKKEGTKAEAKAETKAMAKEAAKGAGETKRAATPKTGGLMVNINTANVDELKSLKGIGDTRAKDIIEYRKKNGDFKSIEDLEKVKGIGPGTMKQIRANIAVTGETMIPKKAEPAAKAKDTKAPAKAMEKMEEKAKK